MRRKVDSLSTVEMAGDLGAWGDESGSIASEDPGVHILSAAVVNLSRTQEVREEATRLLLPRQKKAHWRDDSDARHDAVIKIIADLPVEALVVVRQGPTAEKDERRRRKCFETFATELEDRGCTNLTLESRGDVADSRDRDMLSALRAKKLSKSLRLDHKAGPADPLLWIADAVCGAVVASRTGQSRWLDELAGQTRLIVVDHRP